MNLSELARKLHTTTTELREKLPGLGFDVGSRAIKVDDTVAQRILEKWSEAKRKERVQEKFAKQKEQKTEPMPAETAAEKRIRIPPQIVVRDFAARLGLPVTKVIQELMKGGILATLNDSIDFETAAIVSQDLGFVTEAESAGEKDEEEMADRLKAALGADDKSTLKPRPPVVVVMGHVDHGKTALLDRIRETNVVAGEAGGITQHIGAYQVIKDGHRVTFIDTPGHEAFTVMRSRGAKVADIAILVVAADDGVRPQTKEAVDIIKAAGLPYVVAINKIDRPEANVEKVKSQLGELGLIPEEWGGKIRVAPVSAKTGEGIPLLLEGVLKAAGENKEKIMANPLRKAAGTIIESHLDKGAGPVATMLVQTGTLWPGDILGIRGVFAGKVRKMLNWKGEEVEKARPGRPVQIIGFKLPPQVGDIIEVAESMAEVDTKSSKVWRTQPALSVEKTTQSANEEGKPTLNIVLRADVLGSIEALLGMFERSENPEVRVRAVKKGLGQVNENDVLTAEAADAVVYAFTVPVLPQAEELAREKGVEILKFDVIYHLLDDVKRRVLGLLPKETVITELGKLKILAVFKEESGSVIAGGRVTQGKLAFGAKLRISRGGEYIGEGEILELQAGKQPVREVRHGQECGIKVQSKTKLEVSDILEAYIEEVRTRKLTY